VALSFVLLPDMYHFCLKYFQPDLGCTWCSSVVVVRSEKTVAAYSAKAISQLNAEHSVKEG